MPTFRRVLARLPRLAGPLAALALLVAYPSAAAARDAGSPENFDRRMKYRYSFEYAREHGMFGRPGQRLKPGDPRGHMSGGHGGLM